MAPDTTMTDRMVRQLRAAVDSGMEVSVVCPSGPVVDLLESWSIRHLPLRRAYPSPPVTGVSAVPELIRLFRKLEPGIVHTHGTWPGVPGSIAARVSGVPGIVHSDHEPGVASAGSVGRRTTTYALGRLAAACIDVELVDDLHRVARPARARVPSDRRVALPVGIDLERFRPQRTTVGIARARASLGLPPSAVVVGTVDGLVPSHELRKLLASTRARVPHLDVHVVTMDDGHPCDGHPGDWATRGAASSDARPVAPTELDAIVSVGRRQEREELYPGIDLFVLPAVGTRVPRTAMEAAACGLPVITVVPRGRATSIAAGNQWIAVPDPSVDGLSEAVADLANDPARRGTMGARSRAKAEAEFDDRPALRSMLDAYRRLPVDRRSTGRSR